MRRCAGGVLMGAAYTESLQTLDGSGRNPHKPWTESLQGLDKERSTMKKLDILAAVLVAVGGINWGLVALASSTSSPRSSASTSARPTR
jgi:hypothetical protein